MAGVVTVCLLYSAADALAGGIHLHTLALLLLLLLLLLHFALQSIKVQLANRFISSTCADSYSPLIAQPDSAWMCYHHCPPVPGHAGVRQELHAAGIQGQLHQTELQSRQRQRVRIAPQA
jgi:hypothetical protein